MRKMLLVIAVLAGLTLSSTTWGATINVPGDYLTIQEAIDAASDGEVEELRSKAVIALGPGLEHGYIYEFDDPEDIVLSEKVFKIIQASLERAYHDAKTPKNIRRSVLEAAVRAPQTWQEGAVRAAYQSDDPDWQLTAVFCMSYIPGFKAQILESLTSNNPDIHYQAVRAAGHQDIEESWPQIKTLLSSEESDKALIFAAIEAAVVIGAPDAMITLTRLLDANDDEIVDAADESLAMLEAFAAEGEEEL